MPYTKANLPDHVKAMSATAQRQWMHIANGCMADGKPEGKCITMANGVVKKRKDYDPAVAGPLTLDEAVDSIEGDKSYQYIESWDVVDRQIPQAQAGYNPLGATGTEGCANCQWFLAPSRCVVVAGDISPTGHSNLWMAKVPNTPTPLLVEIVGGGGASDDIGSTISDVTPVMGASESPKQRNLVDRAVSALKSALIGERSDTASGAPPVQGAAGDVRRFTLTRTKENRLRFFTAWSNNFEDREGEYFPEYAHKEFVEWADRTGQYPELWLWHTKGTKYGRADWLDLTDGFVFASGLIDEGCEALAEKLAQEDVGVSHGFFGMQRGKEIIQYRSYEISTLPRTNAAVWTTSFNILAQKGVEKMGFNDTKKKFLKEHGMSDEQIAAAETQATNLASSLKALGVNWKDADLVEDPVAPTTATPAHATAVADATKAAPDHDFQKQILAAIDKQNEVLATLAGSIKSVDDRVKAVEKTDDEKVAAALVGHGASAATTTPYSASKDTQNVVDQKQTDDAARFFGETFLASLGVTSEATAAR